MISIPPREFFCAIAARPMHTYEVRPRRDKRGIDLISDVLPFGRLWYNGPDAIANAISYAEHSSRSHDAAIRVNDDAGNVIETARRRALSPDYSCSTVRIGSEKISH
jgi:hypothetical protein